MKILHLNTAHTWRGGEAQVFELTKRLKIRGHNILLVSQPNSALANKAKNAGITTTEINMHGELDLVAVLKLIKIIKHFKPDIIHTHTAHAHMLGLLSHKIAKQGKLIVARRVDFPIKNNLINRFKYGNTVSHFITVSNGIKEVLMNFGIPEPKITTIYSGIDLDKFRHINANKDKLCQEFKIKASDFIVGNVAALAPHKDQSTLLQAAAKVITAVPNTKFLIVGEGELENSLKMECAKLNLQDHIIFTGFRKDIGEILQALDLFVLSSSLEGLGTSLLDAMLCSLPIVATKTGGIPEAVLDGENGLLVPPKSPTALASSVIKLLHDPHLRENMGNKGRELANNFSVENTMLETEKVYKALCN